MQRYIPPGKSFLPCLIQAWIQFYSLAARGEIESKGENVKKGLVDVQLGLREKIIIMFLSNLLFYLKSHPTIVLKF